MAEEDHHHHHLFHHKKEEETTEVEAVHSETSDREKYEKEEKSHKHKEHLGEMGVVAASAFALVTSVKELSGQICQICGDEVEFTVDGEPFVACNECAFPVCRSCYEYDRREGNQSCPQCKTRFKRIKGSPRVDGDED
ncbi:hypothetical protein MIMGU_mgv1a016004mg [Erythranthe guttata]|uniref:RING-type domain-containing protein n=1 Tax=Erythranthe guttata TaxID=4155 RepID=A0A022PN09_ERYGU|nr:hypothetical protein MIMGU_mgv1a016004mg [Erythranthe guttata]